jgi:sorbitol/mannitol transport system substrate-binding protein
VRMLRTLVAALASILATSAFAETQLTIATVNNSDMIIMQRLSKQFEAAHPDIKLNWVVLEENTLRERVTTDIATKGGAFDILTIGTYEAPIWGKKGWLVPFDDLPASYDVDGLIKPIRDGLSVNGKLFALPFYGESSFIFYRKDLLDKVGVTMPEKPTYADIDKILPAFKKADPAVYPLCLRGKPGWGENMAFFGTLVNTFGGRWFDEKWKPELTSPEWKAALKWYIDNMKKYGPPGASSNGHNENRALFATGKCGMWVDATSAAGYISNPKDSQVADKVAFAVAPTAKVPNGAQWLWSWALGVPASTKSPKEAKEFVQWATSKEYAELVAKTDGWTVVPPGTRVWTYEQADYQKAAPFAKLTLQAIQQADPIHSSAKPIPYTGVQFVAIPEFQAIGGYVGQQVAAALVGKTSPDKALQNAQEFAERAMKKAGYYK